MADLPNTPETRREMFLNAVATGNVDDLPDPITREEMYLDFIAENASSKEGVTPAQVRSIIAEQTDDALSDISVNPVQNKVINSALSGKVDKVSGKGLSTNDYTTDEKNKLAGIENAANKTTVDTALSSTSENPLQNKAINSALSNKVDKVSGKGLSTNDYTTTEKNKLAGIASGAEVNVQSDWNVTTTSSDAYIKNKPTSLPASDVSPWAKASTKPSYTKSEIGLDEVDNTADSNKNVNTAQYLRQRTMTSSEDSLNDIINANDYTLICRAANTVGSVPANDSWFDVINFGDDNTKNQNQLAISSNNSGVYYRRKTGDTWFDWVTVFDTKNCTVSDYDDNVNYVKFANGIIIQWGISLVELNSSAIVTFAYEFNEEDDDYKTSVFIQPYHATRFTTSYLHLQTVWTDSFEVCNNDTSGSIPFRWMAIGRV